MVLNMQHHEELVRETRQEDNNKLDRICRNVGQNETISFLKCRSLSLSSNFLPGLN